jgi:hypothetical protein
MDAVTNPPAVMADPTDDEYPGCEAIVQASIIGLLPTPQLRTAAFLATLRTEVARRSGKEHTTFPVDQVVEFVASVDRTVWWCRLCGQEGTARTTPQATDDAVAHLGTDHGGVRDTP